MSGPEKGLWRGRGVAGGGRERVPVRGPPWAEPGSAAAAAAQRPEHLTVVILTRWPALEGAGKGARSGAERRQGPGPPPRPPTPAARRTHLAVPPDGADDVLRDIGRRRRLQVVGAGGGRFGVCRDRPPSALGKVVVVGLDDVVGRGAHPGEGHGVAGADEERLGSGVVLAAVHSEGGGHPVDLDDGCAGRAVGSGGSGG